MLSGGAHSTSLTLADSGASFANAQTGAAVVVSGVANGLAATDAANVGQVSSAINAAVAPLDARLTTVESNIQALGQQITDVERKLSGGIAIANALSQPVSFAPDAKNSVTMGAGYYNSQSAVAISYNRLLINTANSRLIISGGFGATTDGQKSGRIGGSLSW